MKTLNPKSLLTVFAMFATVGLFAQSNLQYFRPTGQDGLNVFETPKTTDVEFDGVKVEIGGDFAIQFQALDQTNNVDSLVELGSDFNLPTANLNINAQLADGMRVHLRTYLSARHHNESWVKGGHIQIDKLDFIKPGLLSGLMNVMTVTVGLDEINYGDAHFRRTDNARAYFNPFVGNYIMDSFTTEAFGEVTVQSNGLVAVLGISNGKLNQSANKDVFRRGGGAYIGEADNKPSVYGKLGYDSQINDDLRLRLTGSFYTNSGLSTGSYLYGGDRGGDRYYYTFFSIDNGLAGSTATDQFAKARFNPRFSQLTAIQVNPFVKFKGLEFFGIYEVASNSDDQGNGQFTQVAGEVLYRFGAEERWYLGGRYNTVSGESVEGGATRDISRINFGGGWFLTKNVLAKAEYVKQVHDGAGWNGTEYQDGQFDGFVIEATIGF